MAKDRELADHERAHSGRAGSAVDHGNYDPYYHVGEVKAKNPDYGYRKVTALMKATGHTISTRTVRKVMKSQRADDTEREELYKRYRFRQPSDD